MFQKDFLWGSASAAYQIEGGAMLDGKGPSIWDVYAKIPGNTLKNTNGDVAIDFYHRYKEDIQLMHEMGLKAYRFSISWPRILPNGKGEENKAGIDFYHHVIDEMLALGIEPIVTIYHWDLPQALQDAYQGFESRQIVEDFTNYCRVLYREYGSKVKYWVTMNEQNVFTTLGYLIKLHPPKVSDFQRFLTANHHANLANASAIALFREMVPSGLVGPSFAYGPGYPASGHPNDVMANDDARELLENFWLDVYARGHYSAIQLALIKKMGYHIPSLPGDDDILAKGKPDFMGVNYYQTNYYLRPNAEVETVTQSNTVQSDVDSMPTDVFFSRGTNPHIKRTDWGWGIDPEGLRYSLRQIASRYELPVLITENGLGAYDTLEGELVHDDYRIDYLKQHIEQINLAIEEGCQVLGYCTWSFQDLFSWLNGYAKRYGFVYVDRDEESEKELKRYKKDSFYWYKKVIETNGETL